jgi:lysophospholipid acyltransferase (LPLAT)-like uncharacterized protein
VFRARILPFLAYVFYSALRATWRLRVTEEPGLAAIRRSGQPLVYAHWHGDELALLAVIGAYNAAAMVSTSADGQLMTSVLRWMGVPTARGSSTRGGASALKGLLRIARAGRHPSVAVDGPKGPYHKVKPGVLEISRVVGGDLVPVGCACSRAFVFKRAWNKAFLPLPFAKIEIVFGPRIPAVGRDQNPRDHALALRLEKAIGDAGQQAAILIATPHR